MLQLRSRRRPRLSLTFPLSAMPGGQRVTPPEGSSQLIRRQFDDEQPERLGRLFRLIEPCNQLRTLQLPAANLEGDPCTGAPWSSKRPKQGPFGCFAALGTPRWDSQPWLQLETVVRTPVRVVDAIPHDHKHALVVS